MYVLDIKNYFINRKPIQNICMINSQKELKNTNFKNKNNQQAKQNMHVIIILDGSKDFKNKKGLSAEREFYFQEMHFQEFQKRNSRCKSLALPKIENIKKTEPNPITKKKDEYHFDKQRKIIYCSYQRDLKQMKRSFEIASKLDQDDYRIMKQKTLDIYPKQKTNHKQDDHTFITYV